ncbi:hypothetical protein Oter_4484 [Opitutus terrae PB90-1]|uniref:Transmembrane protein n=2 Tax=Opitutus terrae TaxID=107709 RepID=B1ZQ36_OPITP|nr:hypothetical protein Oter_4484 [Opitutus terrae PB90-1]
MNSEHLNEHDSQQGAESKGEFLGMTGNSAWYLLGSAGVSLLIVVVLWGMLGLSLFLCVFLGIVLCGLSLAYVFVLKNNRPQHYDTDFFEMALVEAGVMPVAFGPRAKRPPNPFRAEETIELRHESEENAPRKSKTAQRSPSPQPHAGRPHTTSNSGALVGRTTRTNGASGEDTVATVPLVAFERLQAELNDTAAMLEDALADGEEEHV